MSFTILDGVILGLLVLAAIIGLITGIKKKISQKLGWLGGMVIATIFYAMLANLILSKTSLGASGANYFSNLLLEKSTDETVTELLNGSYADLIATTNANESLATGLTALSIPKFFASFFITKIYYVEGTVAQALGSAICASIAYGVTYLVLYIVSSLILVFLLKLILRVRKDGTKDWGDRILGMLVRVTQMCVIIIGIMFVLVGVASFVPSLDTWLTEQVNFNSESVTISGIFYNLVWQLINAFKLSIGS